MWPRSKAGWRTVVWGAIFWAGFGLWQWIERVNAGDTIQMILAVMCGGCGSTSLVYGGWAIVKKRDIGVATILATIVSLGILLFALGAMGGFLFPKN